MRRAKTKTIDNPTNRLIETVYQKCTLSLNQQLQIVALHQSGKIKPETICKMENISPALYNSIVNDPELNNLYQRDEYKIKQDIKSYFYHIAKFSISSLTPDELTKMSPYQRVVVASICIDKARLMDGLSTENIAVRDIVPRLSSKLQELGDGYGRIMQAIQKKIAEKNQITDEPPTE